MPHATAPVTEEIHVVHARWSEKQWPRISDPDPVLISQLVPGRLVWVRVGRRRIMRLIVRTVNCSHEGHNRGRRYLTGVSIRGVCHSVWVDNVIRINQARLPQPRELSIRRLELTTGS